MMNKFTLSFLASLAFAFPAGAREDEGLGLQAQTSEVYLRGGVARSPSQMPGEIDFGEITGSFQLVILDEDGGLFMEELIEYEGDVYDSYDECADLGKQILEDIKSYNLPHDFRVAVMSNCNSEKEDLSISMVTGEYTARQYLILHY